MPNHFNVLFLCTGNSARSIMAEAILNGRESRTSLPIAREATNRARPARGAAQMKSADLPTDVAQQIWDEFCSARRAGDGFCVHGLRQRGQGSLPGLARAPMTAHWGVPDPAAVEGSDADEVERAFREAFFMLDRRIGLFLCCRWPASTSLRFRGKSTTSARRDAQD